MDHGIEVKLTGLVGGRWPNGEFQRMAGQCLIARLRHELVIGVFAIRGVSNYRTELEFHPDLKRKYSPESDVPRNHGIHIVVRGLG